jgi:hypothetical protein
MSNWADWAIERLQKGKTVKIRPKGQSMKPKVESGAEVTLDPVNEGDLKRGDIVLCKVGRNQYLHLIKAIKEGRYQIANNKGYVNGWVGIDQIYGKAVKINNGKKK